MRLVLWILDADFSGLLFLFPFNNCLPQADRFFYLCFISSHQNILSNVIRTLPADRLAIFFPTEVEE